MNSLRENIVSLLPDKIKEINTINNYTVNIDSVYFSNVPKKISNDNSVRVYIENEKRKSFLENEESVKQSELMLVLIYQGFTTNNDNIKSETEKIIKNVIEYFEKNNSEYLKHFDKSAFENIENIIEDIYISFIDEYTDNDIINIYFEMVIEYNNYS